MFEHLSEHGGGETADWRQYKLYLPDTKRTQVGRPMSHVFISYKHDDGHFVDSLREKLKAAEIDSWVDTDIEAGEDWKEKIDTAIEAAFAVVVVLTPESHKSPYVTYEWSFAMGLQIPVVPLLLRTVEIHPKLIALEHLSFVGRNAPYDLLIGRLKKLKKINTQRSKANQEGEATEEFKSLLDDLDSRRNAIREAAAITLGELRINGAVSRLSSLFQDPDFEVQIAAISAVAQIGSEKAIPSLISVINRRDEKLAVKDKAHQALAQIGGSLAINYICNRFNSNLEDPRVISFGFTLIDMLTRHGISIVPEEVYAQIKSFARNQVRVLFNETSLISGEIRNLTYISEWDRLEKQSDLSKLSHKHATLSQSSNCVANAELAILRNVAALLENSQSDLDKLDDIPF